jgi:hypothetical protein
MEQAKAVDDEVRQALELTKGNAVDVHGGRIDLSNVKTLGGLISDGMRCREVDPNIGRDLRLPVPQSLTTIMERLSADHAISFELSEPE